MWTSEFGAKRARRFAPLNVLSWDSSGYTIVRTAPSQSPPFPSGLKHAARPQDLPIAMASAGMNGISQGIIRSSGSDTPPGFLGNLLPSRPSKVAASKAPRRQVPGPADGSLAPGNTGVRTVRTRNAFESHQGEQPMAQDFSNSLTRRSLVAAGLALSAAPVAATAATSAMLLRRLIRAALSRRCRGSSIGPLISDPMGSR